MQKASTALLVIMAVSTLGLWGCTQQKNGQSNAKIRELEVRYGKLEEDYRAILAANEANRRKLAQLEIQRTELTQKVEELQTAVRERDELKAHLANRTRERDSAQNRLMEFSKELQALAGRVEAAANLGPSSGGAVSAIPASRKSD